MSSINIEINNSGVIYHPVICGKAEIELCRSGYPGKATFNVLKDDIIDFQEGNEVLIKVGEKDFFKGYVFTKNRDKEGIISVLCYDQLRYLKNRGTYTFDNKKASDIVGIIAADYGLKCGEIENSGYVIPLRTEDDKTLMDIIQSAIDETYLNTGKLFVLYDSCGQLCLKNAENLIADYMSSRETAENYSYESSIDKNTFNQIRLTLKGKKGITQEYFKKDMDGISKWGVLQYTGSIEEGEDGNMKAAQLLSIYGVKSRSLSIKGAFGDSNIRGGSVIYVNLGDISDITVDEKMTVEKVTHIFERGVHTMNLSLKGGLINE